MLYISLLSQNRDIDHYLWNSVPRVFFYISYLFIKYADAAIQIKLSIDTLTPFYIRKLTYRDWFTNGKLFALQGNFLQELSKCGVIRLCKVYPITRMENKKKALFLHMIVLWKSAILHSLSSGKNEQFAFSNPSPWSSM